MKYNWKQLEKDYIKSNYLSIKTFLKSNNINYSGNARKKTKGWSNKKHQKDIKKSQTIEKNIEKIIEKEAEKEANKIVKQKFNKGKSKENFFIDSFINEYGLIDIHKLKISTEKLKKQKNNILN